MAPVAAVASQLGTAIVSCHPYYACITKIPHAPCQPTITKHNSSKLNINRVPIHLARQQLSLPLLLYHISYANTDTDKVAILPTVNCLPKCISLSVYQIDVYWPKCSLSYSVTFAHKYWWMWKHCSSSPYPLGTLNTLNWQANSTLPINLVSFFLS